MKVVTQLIDFFHEKGELTTEEIERLAKLGFCGEHEFFEPEEVLCESAPVAEDSEFELEQKKLERQPSHKKKLKRGKNAARRLFRRARAANKQLAGVS